MTSDQIIKETLLTLKSNESITKKDLLELTELKKGTLSFTIANMVKQEILEIIDKGIYKVVDVEKLKTYKRLKINPKKLDKEETIIGEIQRSNFDENDIEKMFELIHQYIIELRTENARLRQRDKDRQRLLEKIFDDVKKPIEIGVTKL